MGWGWGGGEEGTLMTLGACCKGSFVLHSPEREDVSSRHVYLFDQFFLFLWCIVFSIVEMHPKASPPGLHISITNMCVDSYLFSLLLQRKDYLCFCWRRIVSLGFRGKLNPSSAQEVPCSPLWEPLGLEGWEDDSLSLSKGLDSN